MSREIRYVPRLGIGSCFLALPAKVGGWGPGEPRLAEGEGARTSQQKTNKVNLEACQVTFDFSVLGKVMDGE